jgi:HEAT repeat protein
MSMKHLVLVAAVALSSGGAWADDDDVAAGDGADRIPHLVDALHSSGSFKARAMAAVALGRLGDPRAAPALADALRSDDHYAVRVAAASALGRLPTAESILPLLTALHDQDQFVREEAESALDRFHTPATVFAFRDGLQSDDPITRRAAVRAYGDVLRETPAVAPLVVDALGDDDPDVRKAAETAVAGIPHERAVPLLVGALSTGGSQVRAAAARLLAKRTDKSAVDPLIAVIVAADEDEDTRAVARDALKAHREYLDVNSLAAAAKATAPEARDARIHAIRVLAAVGDGSATWLVESALGDPDPAVRVAAARAAADVGGAQGRKLLEAAKAKESDPRMQKQLELILKTIR